MLVDPKLKFIILLQCSVLLGNPASLHVGATLTRTVHLNITSTPSWPVCPPVLEKRWFSEPKMLPPNSSDANPIKHCCDAPEQTRPTGTKIFAADILMLDTMGHLQSSYGVHGSLGQSCSDSIRQRVLIFFCMLSNLKFSLEHIIHQRLSSPSSTNVKPPS